MLNNRFYRFAISLLAIGTLFGLMIASGLKHAARPLRPRHQFTGASVVLGSQQSSSENLLELQNVSDAFVYIAEQLVPTVVSIRVTRLVSTSDLQKYHDRDELRDLFRFRIPKEYRQHGSGSGIIVSSDGYILTNVHVVQNAQKLNVLLADNREFKAEIVGLDPLTEVAVIKVSARDLPVVRFGDSDSLRVGEWVLAIGNPLDLRSTVTAGIISAKGRQIDIMQDRYSIESFLQTDAAINPGNSGGALVNLRGEVIGVNTAIATETGYNAGFGFAIPINLARKIMSDLIEKGKVERGYLGISMQSVDGKKARALGLDRPQGVFVEEVLRDSPADKSGLKTKDVILTVNGQSVNKSNQLQAMIARKSPGQNVRLEIVRKRKPMTVDVRLGVRQETDVQVAKKTARHSFENLGIAVEDITTSWASDTGYIGPAGALVVGVERYSPVEESGLREGDVIVEINDRIIDGKESFQQALDEQEPGSVAIFTVRRFNRKFHFFVEISAD